MRLRLGDTIIKNIDCFRQFRYKLEDVVTYDGGVDYQANVGSKWQNQLDQREGSGHSSWLATVCREILRAIHGAP